MIDAIYNIEVNLGSQHKLMMKCGLRRDAIQTDHQTSGGEGADPHSGSLSLKPKFAEKSVLLPGAEPRKG